MRFSDPPEVAAWRHRGAREGFEVAFASSDRGGWVFEGEAVAVEDGEPLAVRYRIAVDARWVTGSVRVLARSRLGTGERALETDRAGNWRIDGSPAPHLEGCLDVDLESSSLTNALPVHRLALGVGEGAEAPAAFVRARDLRVERLEQRYVRLDSDRAGERYAYAAPRFGVAAELTYDGFGLVREYPGLAVRAV